MTTARLTPRITAARVILLTGLLAALPASPPVHADPLDAAAILERARAAVEAGGSRSAEFTLEVSAPTWSAKRHGRFYKDIRPDGRASMIVLDDPEPLRGVKVLSQQSRTGSPQQWLYVPSTHRARRIAAGESGRSLFGSDFSASDLEQRRPGLHTALEQREVRDGHDAYVLAITGTEDGSPVDERVWIRTGDFRLVRREFRMNGAPQRIYTADAVQTVEGIPTTVAMTVVNVAGATRARIRLRNVRYGATFDPTLFAAQHLDDRTAVTASRAEGGKPFD